MEQIGLGRRPGQGQPAVGEPSWEERTAVCPAAQDEEVRWMLRDERLQKVIQGIDSAPDRERVSYGCGGECVIGEWWGVHAGWDCVCEGSLESSA